MGGVIAAYLWNFWLAVGFLPGFLLLLYVCRQAGFTWQLLGQGAAAGMKSIRTVAYILTLVSLLVPCWMGAGIISYVIDWGLGLLAPQYFLTCAFLLTAIVAILLGTSTGSLSAVGVPLMGIGAILGVPSYLTGGAVVSGAFVGDRTSPLASANQLVADFVGLTMPQQMRILLPTSILAIGASLLFFVAADHQGQWQVLAGTTANRGAYWHYFGPWLLVPPVILLSAIGLRCSTVNSFLLAVGSGIALGSWLQGVTGAEWLEYLVWGYQNPAAGLLGRGLIYMLPLVAFVLITGAFNGILDATGIVQPYIARVFAGRTSLTAYTWRLGVFGIVMNIICCNQTMPIMITAGSVRPVWLERFRAEQLGRVVADTSLVVAGLIPWNLFALICSNIINVPVGQYAWYAVFLWIMPPVTLFWSWYEQRRAVAVLAEE